jgi:hypothetical protein
VQSASAATLVWKVQVTPAAGQQNAVSCSWSSAAVPRGAAALTGVSCTSATHCIAVGQTTGKIAGAWLWNGTSWSVMAVFNPKSANNALEAIRCASASSCEAVGYHDGGGTRVGDTAGYPLAEAWNGSTWADQSTTGAPYGYLTGVACESMSKCEAVGTAADSASGSRTLAMGLRGSTWITQATLTLPNQFGSPPGFYGWLDTNVSCWSSGCKAVGNQDYCDCSPESSGTLLFSETWNGTKWSLDGTVGRPDPPDTNSA